MEEKNYISDLVSIIIPTYNSEKFIKKTVLSALQQTYKKIEIIIVDDCSKDNTRSIIRELSEQDCRVRFVFQEKNQTILSDFLYIFSIFVLTFSFLLIHID